MDEMLNDDCLLHMLKMLNLNERAQLRLINRRWKRLCDSISIKRLIIFEKQTAVAGELCVCVNYRFCNTE